MKTWMTSDTHFGHANIIKYCTRPFADVALMDAELIKRWNSKISQDDVVYHLGDFALGMRPDRVNNIIGRLNFSHLHVIKGNHEKSFTEFYREYKPRNVSFYGSYLETKIHGREVTLCHYALQIWNKKHHNALHLYGHSHGTLPDDLGSRSTDVGVDTNDYYPYDFDELQKMLDKREFVGLDHHT